jgi:hypothetical protein
MTTNKGNMKTRTKLLTINKILEYLTQHQAGPKISLNVSVHLWVRSFKALGLETR